MKGSRHSDIAARLASTTDALEIRFYTLVDVLDAGVEEDTLIPGAIESLLLAARAKLIARRLMKGIGLPTEDAHDDITRALDKLETEIKLFLL
jgi:hypothetical protein